MPETQTRYVYGPVKSWRTGTSLGIDPIGDTSTCSFNCSYCQLGQIQARTIEKKVYVKTASILNDFQEMHEAGLFKLKELDVITFAGSGEPTLAANLAEIIQGLRSIIQDYEPELKIPISILTNATTLQDKETRAACSQADLLSLKLDAPDEESLRSINQPVEGLTVDSIIEGINIFKEEYPQNKTQLQIMFMPKFVNDPDFIAKMAEKIKKTKIFSLQINTPTRPKPKSAQEYWIETRGNHYANPSDTETNQDKYKELPIISKEQAFFIEDSLKELLSDCTEEIEVINVYKRD